MHEEKITTILVSTVVILITLMTRSNPTVNKYFLTSSKLICKILCFASWNVANEAFLFWIVFFIIKKFKWRNEQKKLIQNQIYSSSLNLSTHLQQILTWNSCPRAGIGDLDWLQELQIAEPHLLQWCCLFPTVFCSHIALKFQKNGFLQYSQKSLSFHSGFALRGASMSHITIFESSEPEISCRVRGINIIELIRSLWPSRSYVMPFCPPMSQQIIVLSVLAEYKNFLFVSHANCLIHPLKNKKTLLNLNFICRLYNGKKEEF